MTDQLLSLEQRRRQADTEYDGFKKHFPQVEDITAVELHELLERDPDSIILLDARTPEERQVSILPGKVVSSEEFERQRASLGPKLVVCYCTAGMRSGKYAAKLQREGVNVKNLKSSIVAWTQEGYPLVKGNGSGEQTRIVHAFGPQWAAQMGNDYELQTFNKARGALEITRTALPKWLGGTT